MKDLGDYALVYALNHINEIAKPNTIPLVLTEDKNLRATTVAQGTVHVLSTRSWLKGLETARLIPSAADLLERINTRGRKVARLQADHPARTNSGKTDWVNTILKSAMTNDQLLARFAVSDERTKSVLHAVLLNAADSQPRQDTMALGALAPKGAQDLVLAAARVGDRLASAPDPVDDDLMKIFSTAEPLAIDKNDIKILADSGASDGFVRAARAVVNERDGPTLS